MVLFAQDWKPTVRLHALASKVLVVAKTRVEGTWSAYCDAVPGDNHELEVDEVLKRGDKMPEYIARVLFPEFKDIPYAS